MHFSNDKHVIPCYFVHTTRWGGIGTLNWPFVGYVLCVSAMSGFLLNISFIVPSNFETNPPPYLFNPVVKNLAEYYSN